MGQVELPVHTQLHEHIVGGAGTALSHLIKDGFPAFVRSEAGIQGHGASVPGLEGQGVDVVGDFGLTQFVHVWPISWAMPQPNRPLALPAPVTEVGLPWTRAEVEPYSTPMWLPAAYMKAPANMRM